MGKRRRKQRYEPMGEEVTVDNVLLQATSLLDIASQRAVESGDIQGMANVAEQWSSLAATMTSVFLEMSAHTSAQNDGGSEKKTPIGFSGGIDDD